MNPPPKTSPSRWRVTRFLPGAVELRHYDRSLFRHDFAAALVVALVTIPSSIAYADLAKCAPAAGLYAAIAAMVAFGLFTSSRHVICGPDATIGLMVGAAIGPIALGDPGKAVGLASLIALLTAGVLLLMARLRLGIAADFLSSPAMQGFMNGAAVVIIGSQIGRFSGIRLEADYTLQRFAEWFMRLGEIHPDTLLTGLACIAVLALCKWKFRRMPGAVIVFLLAMGAGRLIDFTSVGMQVIGTVDLRLPDAVLPELQLAQTGPLFMAAIAIALLVFSEGIVLARTVAGKHHYTVHADRELVAFGASNIAVALVSGFPVGSSQTRTLLNDASGGRTRMVSLLAAAITAAFVFLFAPWIETMPSVAVAAILVFTGITLIDPRGYQRLWRLNRFSMIVATVTTIGVITIGVLPGIMLGIVISLLGVMAEFVRPHDALLGRIEGSETMHDVGDDSQAKTIPGLVVYRFYGPLFFANVRYFIERVESFIACENTPVRQLILDARAIPGIDLTAVEQLREFSLRLHSLGIELVLAKAHLPLRQALEAINPEGSGTLRQFEQLAAAVDDFLKRSARGST